MKKQILIGLILASSVLTVNAQWTGSSSIEGNLWRNGSIGIGTTSPSEKLDIIGNIGIPGYNNYIKGGSWNYWGSSAADYGYYGMCLRYNNNRWESFHSTLNGMAMKFIPNGIEFITTPANTIPATISTLMTINSNGKVGIGNDNPVGKLEIKSFGGDHIRLTGTTLAGGIWTIGDILGFGSWNSSTNRFFLNMSNGNLGIGTDNPAYKLDVKGTIRACEVKVDLLNGCDFVFKSEYKLMDLKELEKFVKTNQHLPEIASEKEMVENGVNMKELQMKLLQKMEEMTLYMIEQNKRLEQQNEKIMTLENEIKELKTK